MDSSESPPVPGSRVRSRATGAHPVNVVALAAWGFFLVFATGSSPDYWWVNLIAILFSFTALRISRGWVQRVLGVFLCGLSGAFCLMGYASAF